MNLLALLTIAQSAVGAMNAAGVLSQPGAPSVLDAATIGVAAKFVPIEPGNFLMGSPKNEPGRFKGEDQHPVTLTRGFEIQATEVTQLQYLLVMGNNPSFFQEQYHCRDYRLVSGRGLCPNNPVEKVNWHQAQAFIARLNELQNEYVYRLPTEAEWEYAARAGTTSPYSGDPASTAWYMPPTWSRGLMPTTRPVATKQPNPWGLYDMHGNVMEWTQDIFGDYPKGAVIDPTGASSGSHRVVRGGSWRHSDRELRSAARNGANPYGDERYVGFRLVRERNQATRRARAKELQSVLSHRAAMPEAIDRAIATAEERFRLDWDRTPE